MHIASMEGMVDFVARYVKTPCRVLDVGSCIIEGDKSYRDLNKDWEYVGCDVSDGKNVNVVLEDPYKWDMFEDNEFDYVISGQAFEHIDYPWLTICEIARVLKPNGYACIIAPAICPIHFYPKDTYRFNPDGFRALATWARLETVEATWADWDWNEDITCTDSRLIARKP